MSHHLLVQAGCRVLLLSPRLLTYGSGQNWMGLRPMFMPTGLPTSEQYVKLEEERRHRQRLEKDRRKKKRKEKKGKTRRHSSLHTESDEDIAPAQQVDIVTEEMPEVSLSARHRLLPASM